MKIELGKTYRTRDGRKVGPMMTKTTPFSSYDFWGFIDNPTHSEQAIYLANGRSGGHGKWSGADLDIIAEWTDGPVVTETVTKTRIVPGTYDGVQVGFGMAPRTAYVYIYEQRLTPDELDAAAAVLSTLAKGLRDA